VLAISAGGAHSLALVRVTPQDQITALIAQVQALVTAGTLAQNQANPLINKLNQVITKLDNGQTNAACGQLGAFINQVNAFINSGSLTAAQGQALIDAANAVRTSMGC
jgi:ABC-type transporter Mla subunit MlaD